MADRPSRHRQTHERNEPTPTHETIAFGNAGQSALTQLQQRTTLMNQVTAFRAIKNPAAIPLQRQIVQIDERFYGPAHSSTGLSYNKLGEIYFELGMFSEAEEPLRKVRRSSSSSFYRSDQEWMCRRWRFAKRSEKILILLYRGTTLQGSSRRRMTSKAPRR